MMLAGCAEEAPRTAPAVAVATPAPKAAVADRHKGPWTAVAPGLDARMWVPEFNVEAQVLRFETDCWELRVGSHARGRKAPEYRRRARAIAAVNGGFFDRERRSLGLRISEGTTTNPWREEDWGVFFVRDGRAGLVHSRDWPRGSVDGRSGPSFAVQAGPRLVVEGEPISLKPSRAKRTAIGTDREGRVYLIVTREAVLLERFARALAQERHEGGLALQHALNLDGGPSSQLSVDPVVFDKARDIEGRWPVPDAIQLHGVCAESGTTR